MPYFYILRMGAYPFKLNCLPDFLVSAWCQLCTEALWETQSATIQLDLLAAMQYLFWVELMIKKPKSCPFTTHTHTHIHTHVHTDIHTVDNL